MKRTVHIYGKSNCKYCEWAKKLAGKHFAEGNFLEVSFINCEEEGISKEALSNQFGVDVQTYPQVLINQQLVGGYTEFDNWCDDNL